MIDRAYIYDDVFTLDRCVMLMMKCMHVRAASIISTSRTALLQHANYVALELLFSYRASTNPSYGSYDEMHSFFA